MSTASYAYRSVGLLCGLCSFQMHCEVSQQFDETGKFVFRAQCQNEHCPNYMILYDVGEEAKVTLTPTAEKGVRAT